MRLIDADALKEKIDNIWNGRPLSFLGARILATIDHEPTIDAVEVVRCKDCKYWHSNTEFCNIWSHANFIAQRTLADGYCSRGERKGGDDE